MFQMNVFAFDIAKIVERFHQNAQINFFFLGTARVPEHANEREFCSMIAARVPQVATAAAPPSSVMNCRRLMVASLPWCLVRRPRNR